MNDFALNKESKQNVKIDSLQNSVKNEEFTYVKPLIMLLVLSAFIILSLQHDNLFMSELLISGGILMLVFVIHFLSSKESIRK